MLGIASVVIAFALAFLFRTFLGEVFVIPTGSMAPTLMGRHKVVTCPQCAYTYTVNADREVEATGPTTGSLPRVRSGIGPARRLGQPPVDHKRLAVLADDDVAWLDVAVEYAAAVRVLDGIADVEEP